MRTFLLIFLVILGLGVTAQEARAHGRVFIGGGVIVGAPMYYYPPYYGYPYYAYPPSPPPMYAAPYPLPAPSRYDEYYRDERGEDCREYSHTIIVDGYRRHAYGHACRWPDGQWRIVD